MILKKIVLLQFLFLIILIDPVSGQIAPWHYKTLIPDTLVDRFIGEISGEIAMSHVYEMAAYNHDRKPEEYNSTYREASYVYNKAKEYGFDSVELEYFDADSIWDGEIGELWEISPNLNEIADYDDQKAVLAKGSRSANLTAELVYVGSGTKESDYEGIDVKDKIVLGYGNPNSIHKIAVIDKGAAGVVSYASIHPVFDPDQIPWFGLEGDASKLKFAFNLGYRRGNELRSRLEKGEMIRVKAVVKTSIQPNRHNVVFASIRGRDLPGESIIFSAHLFEGVTKQGANDNISGSAAILEIGRTYLQLMKNGMIERPRRTIHFIWVPEIHGLIPWVKKHLDIVDNMLVNLNLDMVGAHISKYGGSYNLQRTPFSRPSYLNDVVQNLIEYVAHTNREILNNRPIKFTKPIMAPTGSRDPFYYNIDYHYGSSDHTVFLDWGVGVPAVMPITWPDMYYHSSSDRPVNMDPTQMKRAAFINGVSGYVIANADDEMAMKIASDAYSFGMGRLGREYKRATEMLNSAEPAELAAAYKRAANVLKQAVNQQSETVKSVGELASKSKSVNRYISDLSKDFSSKTGPAMEKRLRSYYEQRADSKGVRRSRLTLTAAEKNARSVVPKPTALVEGYMGTDLPSTALLSEETEKKYYTIGKKKVSELRRLIDGKHNALEITQILDAEFKSPTEVRDVLNYLELLKHAGLVKM
ncbi:MAG: M28 family peptidase [Candidatus Marinimicrobia bacterium]|nr:M28 family peptidase [Candidatus Neomarinimicrobiota bacterium]